jgi:hypothetical protein
MLSTLLISTAASLKYCGVHQRAWVESLGQWVAFPEPTMYGSPVTEAACDACTTFGLRTFVPNLWQNRPPHGNGRWRQSRFAQPDAVR